MNDRGITSEQEHCHREGRSCLKTPTCPESYKQIVYLKQPWLWYRTRRNVRCPQRHAHYLRHGPRHAQTNRRWHALPGTKMSALHKVACAVADAPHHLKLFYVGRQHRVGHKCLLTNRSLEAVQPSDTCRCRSALQRHLDISIFLQECMNLLTQPAYHNSRSKKKCT